MKDIYYLDIGASHPYWLSNTYFFYLKGATGVCVEANPTRADLIRRHRPKDISLNFGVCAQANSGETRKFYVMRSSALSTFSKELADNSNSEIVSTEDMRMISVNDLVRNHCKRTPNFVSVDVEGMDSEILRSIDFKAFAPEVVCVETLTYGADQTKLHDLIMFMIDKGYCVVADTYVNTIFVRADKWQAVRSGQPSTIYPTPAAGSQ